MRKTISVKMEIQLLSKNEEAKWSEYVNAHQNSDIYNTLIWKDLVRDSYGYEPKCYIAFENEKVIGVISLFLIKGVFNKKLSSGPFAYYARLLSNNNQISEAMISKAIEEAKRFKVKYLELKPVEKLSDDIINKLGLIEIKPYKLTILKLMNYEALQENFLLGLKKNLKRYRRKMEEEKLRFCYNNDEGKLKELWNLILEEYVHKFGVPCGPYKAFKTNYRGLKDSYKIFTIKDLNGKIVAGYIFILFNDKAIYLHSVTHKEYTSLNLSTLLTEEAIKWCCNNGIKVFSFGPSNSSQEGLISFKEKWGSITSDMYYYYYPISGGIPSIIGFGSNQSKFKKICRFLPLSLIKFTLPIIAKYMG